MGEGMLTMGGGGRIRGKWIRPGGRAGQGWGQKELFVCHRARQLWSHFRNFDAKYDTHKLSSIIF